MCAYKDNSDIDSIKKREYLKQQHQLRTMTKTNNALSADDMIENLLSKKEIFKMKKDPNPPLKNSQTNYPGWIYPGHEPALYKRVWDIVVTPTGFADTPKLTSLLLTSRLSTDVLGYIWSLSNISLAPALSQLETYTSLALIGLVQNGYSFTSAAVLNTLKEAPIPKLDYPLTEGPIIPPGPMMMVGPPAVSPMYPVVSPIVQPSTVLSPSNIVPMQVIPTVPSSNTGELKSFELQGKTESQSATSPPSNSTIQSLSNELSLLDLDLSLSQTTVKPDLPKPFTSVPTGPILDKENSIDFTADEFPPDYHTKRNEKDLISEFSPTSSKNKGPNSVKSYTNHSTLLPQLGKATQPNHTNILVDDLFGDFQSVTVPEVKNVVDDEEFDDFKSADFTHFTLLEVKEKPPENEFVSEVPPPEGQKVEDKGGIEDLFPKCVVKGKEDDGDLLASSEDRYSALRGLTETEETDEFGDFLTAAPPQPTALPPLFTTFQPNIQERAMEACIDILEEAVRIFDSIDKEEVLNEVITDPRGIQYLEELIEVERIALRLRSNLDKEDLKNKLQQVSSSLEQFLNPHRHTYMAEENGPKCGICLCDRGPAYVKYGINNFHAPCANLYLHKVDSNLPIAPVM